MGGVILQSQKFGVRISVCSWECMCFYLVCVRCVALLKVCGMHENVSTKWMGLRWTVSCGCWDWWMNWILVYGQFWWMEGFVNGGWQGQKFRKTFKNVKIIQIYFYIWIHHGKCNPISTNMPGMGQVVCEIGLKTEQILHGQNGRLISISVNVLLCFSSKMRQALREYTKQNHQKRLWPWDSAKTIFP